MKLRNKLLSVFLAVLMIVGVVPFSTFAAMANASPLNINTVIADATPVADEGWYWDGNTLYVYQGKITKGELYNALSAKYGSGTYKYGTSKPTLGWGLGGTEVKSGQTGDITLSGGTLYVGKKKSTFSWTDYTFSVQTYGYSTTNFPTVERATVHMDGNVQAGEQHVTLKAAIIAAAVKDWGDYAGITPTVYAYDDGTLSTGWQKLEWFIDSALRSGIYPATASRPIKFEWPASGNLPAYTVEVGIVFSDHNRTSNPVVTAPTCTVGGYTTYTCDCGLFTVKGNETAALGHTWVDATYVAPKTCSTCGATEGEAKEFAVIIPEGLTGDLVEAIKNNTALNGYIPENLPEGAELIIELVSVGDKIVYNVTPMFNGTELEPTEAITFRLPVDASDVCERVKVYHEDVLMGTYEIKGEGNAKYVEISSADFSEFAVEPIVPVAQIGEQYFETLAEAFAAVNNDNETVVILSDVTEELVGAYLRGNIVGDGVTITLTNSDWVYCPYTFVIGEGVTLKTPALFYYAGGATVKGTLITDAYYQRYAGTKLYVEGTMTVTGETFILRYTDGDANAGIYVNGGTLNASVIYFYQGMISATNGTINVGTYWQTNETDGQGSTNLALDNSTLNVTVYDHPAKATGNSTVTLKNGSKMNCENGGFTYGEKTLFDIDSTSTIIGKGNTEVKLPVVRIGGTTYATLQDAINAVKNGETIVLLADIAEDVVLTEKTGLYYTIDGNGKTMTGTISVNSLSDTEDNRRITIKDINFVDTTDASVDFISSVNTNHYPRLTVEGCTFTGSGNDGDVALRLKSSHSVIIKDCTGTGLHSFLQNTSGWNLTIENVTVTDSKGGLALGTVQGVTVKGCNITARTYGIRMDAQYNNNAVIESNTINAFIPVVVRKAEVVSTVTFTGTNTMTATNTDGYWMAIGTSEYEENGKMPSDPTGKITVTLADSGLDREGIYSPVIALDGSGTQADPYQIGSVEELIFFRDSVNAGETKYNAPGVYVVLTADIDLAGIDWSVNIGDDCNATFDGIFDGKNHTIKNLTSTETAQKGDGYICTGLFGAIYGSAQIKNLIIENVNINVGNYTGNNVGAVVGFVYSANGAVIENVKVIGDIQINAPGAYGVGAIVGYAYYGNSLTIKNCSVAGNDGSAITAKSASSGIIGYSSNYALVVEGCTVNGVALNATAIAGGLAGVVTGGTFTNNKVENVTITVTGANWKNSAAIAVGALASTSVTVSNTTYNNVNVTAIVGSQYAEKPTAPVAKVQAKIGNTYYYDLDGALKVVKAGETIDLLSTYIINAGETKELNIPKDVTIAMVTDDVNMTSLILNYGNLTITGEGKLSYKYTGNDQSDAHNTIESAPGSTLTVKSGTIENLSENCLIAYAIDGLTNGGNGDVTINIEGGKISSKKIAVRIFANSTTNTGTLNISGGEICGRVIIQNASAKANKAVLNITGATFTTNGYKTDVLYVGGSNGATGDITASVSGGTFNGEILSSINAGFITGGTFNAGVADEFIIYGYSLNENNTVVRDPSEIVVGSGTWGGIDWTLYEDGTLVIAPTKGEPVPDKNAPTKRTYEVGEWRETVIYKSNGSASAIGGAPYDMKAVKKLIIEEGVTYIGSFTCQFPNLTGEVVIPSTVTYIGQEAFHKTPITKLTFAAGGTEGLCIANGAFKKLSITEISFPGDREYIHIHHWAFGGCTKLETAYIPGNITKIWGGEHVDYFDNFNSQTNPSWTYTSSIFTGCTAMQTIVFENETARDIFFGSNRNSTAEDPIVAYAGLIGYNTFDEALAAALENGVTLGLAKNVTLKDTLVIPAGKTLVFNLNGKTLSQSKACTESYEMILNKGSLTITGNGKISFTDTSAGDPNFGWGSYTIRNEGTLVVENGTIEHKGAQAFATHMICAIFQYSGSTTINGGTISTPNYRSVRLWKGEMTINGGTFDGQVWVQAVDNSAKLTINGGTFGPNGGDASSVFVSNADHDVEFAVNGGKFDGKIGVSDATKVAGAVTGGSFNETAFNNTNATIIAENVVFITNNEDSYYVAYATLADAFAAVEDGETIVLVDDITVETGITNTKNVTLDLNGKTITGTDNGTVSFGLITNKAQLTITGNGKITLVATNNRGWNAYSSVISNTVGGKLIVESGTIEHLGGTDMAYAIDNLTNGKGTYAETVINGGIVKSTYRAVRQFLNGVEAQNILTVNGGTIEGTNKAIWMQGANKNANTGTITIGENAVINGDVFLTSTAGATEWPVEVSIAVSAVNGSVLTSNVPDGFIVENKNGIYGINEYTAMIGNVGYKSFLEAFAAAQNGDTIVLLKSIELSEAIVNTKNITLDLNGKTITGTDNATGSFGLITNKAQLTITGNGTITLVATNNRAWNAYSSVISNTVGGKLIVESGTIEHLGGTDMAYAIDNLTNGKGTYAETVINGGIVKSTYRAIRQFLNGVEAENILTINGGTIEGANKSIWMQDPSKNANTGKLTVGENATIKGDIYLYVTAGSTEWPVEVSIAAAALDGTSTVVTGNVPTGYFLDKVNGQYSVREGLKGSGTETDPYQIGSLEDLILFRDSVNAGETKYNAPGVYVVLTADIDLASVENWAPIGNWDYSFDSNFDGQGHKIMNLKMIDATNEGYIGFFGITANNTIKNFIIENVTIESNGQIVAAAIAYPYYTIVSDITVCGNIAIKGGNYTAGVLGYTRLCEKASNLTVSGNAGSYITGAQVVGGIIADIQMNHGLTADYSNFSVSGVAITGTKMVGGISGIIATQTLNGATVKNVTIKSGDSRVGIVAGAFGGTATIANVTAENVTGATVIVGSTYDGGKAVEAKVGDTYYATLQAAINNANGEVVTLLAPITVQKGEELVIDLKGQTVSVVITEQLAKSYAMITNKGTLTINDTVGGGKISLGYTAGSFGYGMGLYTISNEGGTLIINGGRIENLATVSGSMYDAIDNNSTLGNTYLTINGGEIYCGYLGIRQFANSTIYENLVTVNGGKLEGGNSAIWIQNPGSAQPKANVVITDGYVAGRILPGESTGFDVDVNGGTFTVEVPDEFCAEGYIPTVNADGTYGVKVGAYVAEVNGVKYDSLQAAINAAQNGDTIMLLADIALATGIVNTKNITLDLNGKTITGTDNATGSFGLITNKAQLTITGNGTITLVATNNRGWNAYSSVISNTVGGKLIVESGTIEHLGGTDMAYAIDNLTNGKGTYAETVINGGLVKSTYRAIRQFLNGVEAQNILTVNGGTIEGTNKAIWMQDPSKNANTGKLTVGANAEIYGDIYLFVTEGSTEWPVEVSISAAALKAGAAVTSKNVPTGFAVENSNGNYCVIEAIIIKSATLLYKDMIQIRYKFDLNIEGATQYGMLVFSSAEDAGTYDPKLAVQNKELVADSDGFYYGYTDGIAAKNMGDSQFVVGYVVLSDGSIVYTDTVEYSPRIYAQRMVSKSSSKPETKALCNALMQYGAAAQVFMNYNTDKLMNEGFDSVEYDNAVLGENVFSVDTTVTNGFKTKSANLLFKGAVTYRVAYAVNADIADKVLYAEYTIAGLNKVGSVELTLDSDGLYYAYIAGISAKDMDEAIVIKPYYIDENGVKVYGAELVYSGYEYSRRTISNSSNDNSIALAKAFAMYVDAVDTAIKKGN